MEPWERKVVFALDVEMVTGYVNGRRVQLAARAVLFKTDNRTGTRKVLDTYIHHPKEKVVDYNTRYSRIEPWMVEEGAELNAVTDFILSAIIGHTLVTFSGILDFAALGLDVATVQMYAAKHVELQTYFHRPDGTPYGLGPLVHYFGYERNGRPVIINHNVIDDAYFTLRLYLDQFIPDSEFKPVKQILTNKQFKQKFRL